MSALEPLIRKIRQKNKLITDSELVEILHTETGVDKEKIRNRIHKVDRKDRLETTPLADFELENIGDTLEKQCFDCLKEVIYGEYIFHRPKLPNNKEICDIAIYFDDTILLLQAKSRENVEDIDRFIQKTVSNANSQLRSAVNRFLDPNLTVVIKNIYGKSVSINKNSIKKIIGLVVVNDLDQNVSLDKVQLTLETQVERLKVIPHIFSIKEFQKVLWYFDTPSDFLDYLEKREMIVKNEKIKFMTEEDIIGLYYLSERKMYSKNLSKEIEEMDFIYFSGYGENLESGELANLITRKKENDKYSRYIDDVIEGAGEGYEKDYIEIVHRLHKLTRFARQIIGVAAFQKAKNMFSTKRNFGFRYVKVNTEDLQNQNLNDQAFNIIFSNLSKDETVSRAQLLSACIKCKNKINEVITVANVNYDKRDGYYLLLVDNNAYENCDELSFTCSKLFAQATPIHANEFNNAMWQKTIDEL